MLLYELDIPNSLLVKLVAITSQLKSEIDQGKQKEEWTVGELLALYRANGIILDQSDLYDMIKEPPLNKTISNIQGSLVKFKGHGDGGDVDSAGQDSRDTVKKMAKDAMK
jgi:hypothetical protein